MLVMKLVFWNFKWWRFSTLRVCAHARKMPDKIYVLKFERAFFKLKGFLIQKKVLAPECIDDIWHFEMFCGRKPWVWKTKKNHFNLQFSTIGKKGYATYVSWDGCTTNTYMLHLEIVEVPERTTLDQDEAHTSIRISLTGLLYPPECFF